MPSGEDARALTASARDLSLEEDDLTQLKPDDEAERAAAVQLAAVQSDSDLRVLLPQPPAPAQAAAGGQQRQQRRQQHEEGGEEGADEGDEEDLGPEAAAAIDEFLKLYDDAYLGRALQHLDAFAAAHPAVPPAALERRLRVRGADLPTLRQRSALVLQGIRECGDDEGWRTMQDDPGGLRLLYRHGPQSATTHCFKAGCELECELQELLSMAREFDLVPTWNSYISQTDVLQVSSLVELLVYAAVWLPWPFAERDVLIQAVGMDMLAEDGCLAISFCSPPGGLPEGCDKPAGYDNRTHISILPGSCMRLCPLPPKAAGGKPRLKVVVTTMVESGQWVPEAIITFVLKVFAPFFFSCVVKLVTNSFKDPSAPLPQRIRGRPELYGAMKERVKHFLDGHPDAP